MVFPKGPVFGFAATVPGSSVDFNSSWKTGKDVKFLSDNLNGDSC